MEKSQSELAAAIANSDNQVSSASIYDFRKQHFTADEAAIAGFKSANLDELRPIFVAQRQQKQQVIDPENIQFFEFFRERRTDAL